MAKKYIHYSAEDFTEDSFFIRWVKHPDEESTWFWESFINEHPEKRQEIEKAKTILSLINFRNDDLDDASLSSIRNRLLLTIQEEKAKNPRSPKRNLAAVAWRQWGRVAAVFLIVCSGLGFFMMEKNEILRSFETNHGSNPQKANVEERINPRGQKSVLLLPDGTKVWLNADSKLTYSKDFNKRNKREVHLEGEAFFNVTHNERVPFIVQTSSSIRIEVLGTSFNVKSYEGDQTVETTLVNGKVSIDKLEENGKLLGNLILKPNQRAVYFKETNTLNVEEVNAQNLSSWRHDRLVFDEAPFNDVIVQLERWYNVKIHVEDKVNLTCRLTADIQHESLENVLKLLQTSHQIEYRITDNEIFIYGKLCK
jgi:transmembrane sensor